jgi:hypothetical protein
MRGLRWATPFATFAVAVVGVTCAFPTDKSDKVFVTLQSPSHVVYRGQEISIHAQAWRLIGADTQPITNVDFAFTSGGGSIARVDKDCCGYATVTGVNSGNVDIIARLVSFEHAQDADLALRVSNPLEIDSVRPATVHYGEVLTVYGVGVDSMFLASLANVALVEYPFSRLRGSSGAGQISFWVPPPARTDSLSYLGAGVFGFDTATTVVLKDDVYEPNDTTPSAINLDLGGPWPGTALAPFLFLNPALAFEPQDRGAAGEDWFRFSTNDTTQALTFFINYPSTGDTSANTTRTFLLDSLTYDANGDPSLDPIEKFVGRDSADFISSDFQRCKGFEFSPAQAQRESTTVALKTLPSRALHVMTFFTRPQRYGLVVLKGYLTADSRIQADKYEENDMCHYTDSIPGRANPASRIHVSTAGFSDTMNIDNPFEIDWYRIEVPPHSAGDSVLFRLRSRPFFPTARDTSDIDVYVETVPGSTGGGVNEVGSSVNAGSAEDLTLNLPAGSYYVAVVDYAGVAMRYSMCIRAIAALAINRTCALIQPGPIVPGRSKARPQASAPALLNGSRDSFFGSHRRP